MFSVVESLKARGKYLVLSQAAVKMNMNELWKRGGSVALELGVPKVSNAYSTLYI